MIRFVALLAAFAIANAQSLRIGPIYPDHFPNLDIVVEATPAPGSPALRATDLTLIEDGTSTNKAANLRNFSETGHAAAIAVTIDASGSMRGRPMQAIREGLGGFVSRARDYDRIAINTVANDVRWESTWSTPRAELRQKLDGIDARGTLTRLWDALDESLTQLDSPDLPARRRMVVISDGHDEGSQTTLAAVTARAIRMRVPIDSVGITSGNPAYLRILAELSRVTGGVFREAKDTESLKENVAAGIQFLLDTPVATFPTSRIPGDGLTHNVAVRWEPNGLMDQGQVLVPKKALPRFHWWYGVIAAAAALLILVLVLRSRKPAKTVASPDIRPNPAPRPFLEPLPPTPAPLPLPDRRPPTFPEQTAPRRHRTDLAVAFAPPTPERPTAWLRGLEGPANGWRVPIDREEFWLGAEASNHCKLDIDETVSGNHACVRFEGGSLRIYDNHSTNKTWLNRQPLSDAAQLLSPGDQIRIGRSTFVLETES